jgi:hypothetical protein
LFESFKRRINDPLNRVVDTQVEAAYPALESTDPSEVLAYRRKLGNQIDWNGITTSPETAGEARDLTQVKIYHALGNKLHAEIPEIAKLDKVFQPNLELQSRLDAKLGKGISRNPVEASQQQNGWECPEELPKPPQAVIDAVWGDSLPEVAAKRYEVWVGDLRGETMEVIEAENSFMARRIFAAKHEREIVDIAARLVTEAN